MTTIFNEQFKALLKEAQFTKEMLGAGATQIRKANYAKKGVYFQSFTSLATGLERIGKLCLMLDYYLDNQGRFPDSKYFRRIGHDISLYSESMSIVRKRNIDLKFMKDLDGPIHQSILTILSDFACGDRYSNINVLGRDPRNSERIVSWAQQVDQTIFESHISSARKEQIRKRAHIIHEMSSAFTSVLHISESGNEMTNVEEPSFQTGMWEAVAPKRQLFIMQIIRYWVELLYFLQHKAMDLGKDDIPDFNEVFVGFCTDDAYMKRRKTWDTI
jgi:hypothetical protein